MAYIKFSRYLRDDLKDKQSCVLRFSIYSIAIFSKTSKKMFLTCSYGNALYKPLKHNPVAFRLDVPCRHV